MNKKLISKKYFELTRDQKIDWLRLIRSENVGPVTFRDLISHFGTAAAALDAIPDLAKRGGAASRIRVCGHEQAETEYARCEALGARFLAMGEPAFPPMLRTVDPCPPLVCVRGNGDLFFRNALSVVGSRNASISGVKLTGTISRNLGKEGYVIVSGLARGIDAAAHKAALEAGTIAVFAGGVDRIFPEENQELAEQILENDGAFISEMPIGWQPRAKDFPRRNRIIAALSKAVLVVEAARRSGSLITARLANEAGRLVLAVPGSPFDPRSEGTNRLIQQGASLVTSAEDVLEQIAPLDRDAPDSPDAMDEPGFDLESGGDGLPEGRVQETSDEMREKIAAAIGPSPVEIDDIIRYSGATPGEVQLVLIELALAGRLERHAGNRVSILV